nr:hypothetical protein [Pseudarcicella sp.]
LIDPSRDISGIEMKMKWESIFISEEHMGYRAPQNKYEDIKKYINEKLPFKAKIEKISDLDILLEINSSNSEIEDRLDNILFEFNKLEFGIVHSANLHKTKGDKTTFHIDLGSADINKFFKFLLEQLVRMSKNETTIKSVIIKNI